MHDPRGAEDRDAADDAEPRVPGVLRHLLAAGDGDGDRRHRRPRHAPRAISSHGLGHHPPRHRIDRRLADRDRQARLGHRADAAAGAEAARRCPPAAWRSSARISAPWVTSGSSPASLMMPALATPSPSASRARAKLGVSPLGRVIVDRIGKLAGQQRRVGGGRGAPWRRRRWSSRGAGPSAGLGWGVAHGAIVGVGVLKWLASATAAIWLPDKASRRMSRVIPSPTICLRSNPAGSGWPAPVPAIPVC